MGLNMHQNAEKLLSILKNELTPVKSGDWIEKDFRETVEQLCLQVQKLPPQVEIGQRLIPENPI